MGHMFLSESGWAQQENIHIKYVSILPLIKILRVCINRILNLSG